MIYIVDGAAPDGLAFWGCKLNRLKVHCYMCGHMYRGPTAWVGRAVCAGSPADTPRFSGLIPTFALFFPYIRSGRNLALVLVFCWGPSASEGPQKRDLTIFSKYASRYLRNQVTGIQVSGQDEA
jgi:hypothetical protein